MPIVVNTNRCPQNHPCPSIRICPVDALSQSGFEAPAVDESICLNCGKCVDFCPMGALRQIDESDTQSVQHPLSVNME